jgi:cysteine desulfurase family protein (TIGR01976 family)
VVGAAVAATLTAAIANRGTVTPAERRAERVVTEARQAMADLLNGDPGGIVFGRSMTALTYDLSRTLARTWQPGDEVIVTNLDHDANIRPWIQAAERSGVTVRWAEFDPTTGELSVAAVTDLLSERTRLVAVTGASNLLGSRPDAATIAEQAHAAGALVYLDGVHLTPHALADLAELGVDFYVCSPYKFLGPHLGVLAAAPPLLESLQPDKLLPASNAVPERFELGTLPYEMLAGTTAAVDFLADLAPGTGSRRARLVTSMTELAEHEDRMRDRLEQGLADIPGVTRYGAPDRRRTPTVLFTVAGVPNADVYRKLAEDNVNAPAGTFYAIDCARRLGLDGTGAVRAGIAPYTDESDVDRLVVGVERIAKGG